MGPKRLKSTWRERRDWAERRLVATLAAVDASAMTCAATGDARTEPRRTRRRPVRATCKEHAVSRAATRVDKLDVDPRRWDQSAVGTAFPDGSVTRV